VMGAVEDPRRFNPEDRELEVTADFEKATAEMLARAHSPAYIRFVSDLAKSMQAMMAAATDTTASRLQQTMPFTPQVQRANLRHYDDDDEKKELKTEAACDTSFSAGSLTAARRAAGAVVHAVDRVLKGKNRNALCVVRPPGHHAGTNGLLADASSHGFCIFNNVAAGALHALESPEYQQSSDPKQRCERVAIIDIDVHHGNGTEEIIREYSKPEKVLFFSVHLFDKEASTSSSSVSSKAGDKEDREGDRSTAAAVSSSASSSSVAAEEAEEEQAGISYEFYPGSGVGDDLAKNVINVPLMPLWRANKGALLKEADKALAASKQATTRSKTSSADSTNENLETVKVNASTRRNPKAHVDPVAQAFDEASVGGLAGRRAFRAAIATRLVPTLRAFNPSLILLSTGFDALHTDVGNSRTTSKGAQVPGMDLRPDDFFWVTREIQTIADMCCQGRVVSVLEGGYGCDRTAQSGATAAVNFAKPGAFGVPASSSSSAREAAAAAAEASSGKLAGNSDTSSHSTDPDSSSSSSSSSTSGGRGSGGVLPSLALVGSSAYMASPNARDTLDRRHLADASCAHLKALIDPYGPDGRDADDDVDNGGGDDPWR